LDHTRQGLPGIVCDVCEKFLDRFADQANDIRQRRASDSRTIARLIFRTYQQHQNDQWTKRALDLIDRLCREAISDAKGEFEEFER
jgi:hypothetical protein